jgi:hypothetical protein
MCICFKSLRMWSNGRLLYNEPSCPPLVERQLASQEELCSMKLGHLALLHNCEAY